MASASGFAGLNSNGLNDILENAARRLDTLSGSRLSRLLSTTSLVAPSDLPFEDYGYLVAAGSQPLPIANQIRDIAIFTVDEARERIVDFIEGRFHPDSISELVEYLRDKMISIETRILPNGLAANYLVDLKTNKSVPAAQVDERLSHKRMLALSFRTAAKELVGYDTQPAEAFHTWEGLKMAFENHPRNVGYTVFNGKAYLGRVYAVAGTDVEENLEIIRRARNKGIDLIVPAVKDGANGPNVIVPGMPFLVKVNSLPAESIHPGLSHEAMSKAFGMGMPQTFLRNAASMRARDEGEIHSEEEARAALSQFVRKKSASEDEFPKVDDRTVGFEAPERDTDVSEYVVREVGGSNPYLYVFDATWDEEPGFAVASLAEGRYNRETEDGRHVGYTDVRADGTLRHWDLKGKRCVPVADDPETHRELREDESYAPRMAA